MKYSMNEPDKPKPKDAQFLPISSRSSVTAKEFADMIRAVVGSKPVMEFPDLTELRRKIKARQAKSTESANDG